MTRHKPLFQRMLMIEGALNLRDLGGYATVEGHHVKSGMLFRSGHMSNVSDAGAIQMAALGIRCILDFRRKREREAAPTRWHLGSELEYWVPDREVLSGELAHMVKKEIVTDKAMHAAMISLYRDLPHRHADAYRHMFDRLSEGCLPLLFNCAAGKDRTGVAAALVLYALGVPRETITADYLLTNDTDFSGFVARGNFGRLSSSARARLLAADITYLDAMFVELDAGFGGIDGYLEHALGLDGAKRDLLRDVLLDRADRRSPSQLLNASTTRK